MSTESGLVSSLPDKPLSKSAVKSIDDTEGIRWAFASTWQTPIQGDDEFTEDLVIVTDGRVRYLSRERGEGWVIKKDETYADDDEFEHVMDDVNDYACDYAEGRIEKKVRDDYGE